MRAMKTTIEVGFAMASASAKTTVMKPRQPNIDELLHALAISCGGWYSSSSSSKRRHQRCHKQLVVLPVQVRCALLREKKERRWERRKALMAMQLG
mmetsp:Transcript_60064/g.117786  ORF Transcript_60064/g.117786 Transcript_60064/m.117786 type:complete len:96 (-) Transcript_60064:866-1153(-)